MSGIKYILDTNSIISFFQGNPALRYLTSETLGISIISILEYLSFSGMNQPDKELLYDFAKEIEVFGLDKNDLRFMDIISGLRRTYKIKLPDAIIAGTAISNNAILITTDKGFSKIPALQTISFS